MHRIAQSGFANFAKAKTFVPANLDIIPKTMLITIIITESYAIHLWLFIVLIEYFEKQTKFYLEMLSLVHGSV